MKKSIIAILAALTGCAAVQEVEAPPVAQASFEVYAVPVETKTVNDGLSTRWENGDTFSLFHAASGTNRYVADGVFTVDDPETGHARGSVSSLSGARQDWYMVYPAVSGATSPASVSVTVGAAAGTAQAQTGADNMVHLAGPSVPLAGKVSSVATGTAPTLPVAPAVSVLAVNVTNPGDAAVRVTDVKFKAPEAVVGSFTVDVTGASPVFKAVSASDEAVLSVSGESTLEAGENAFFYLVIKPFTAKAGATLTLSVNGQERTVTLSQAVTFAPGRIKTLNFILDKSEASQGGPYYFKQVTSVTPGRKYIFVAEDANAGNVLRMAHPLPEGTNSGRMDASDVAEENGVIALTSVDCAFTFTENEKGFTIRQEDGRYLNNTDADNVSVGTEPNAGYYWTVTFDTDGLASLLNRGRQIQYNPTSSVRKFQTRKTSSTVGINPRLYELQNDGESTKAFLQKSVPGVYDIAAEDWLYADGTHQMAVRIKGGDLTFRLYQPATFVAVQLSGIPVTIAAGDRFQVRLTRFVKQVLTHLNEYTVTVAKVEDGQAWLMADGGTGFIVKTK